MQRSLRQADPALLQRDLQGGYRGGEVSLQIVDVGQDDACLWELGLALQGGTKQSLRARQLSARVEQLGEVIVRVGVCGIARERRLIRPERFIGVADSLETYAQV